MRTILVSVGVFGLLALPAAAQHTIHRQCDAAGECRTQIVADDEQTRVEGPTIAALNRAENPEFLAAWALRAWSPFTSFGAVATTEWSPNDATGSPTSGSVHLANMTVGPPTQSSDNGLRQCVRPGNVVAGTSFTVQANVFVPAGQSVPEGNFAAGAGILMMFYANPDCTGDGDGWGQVKFITPAGTGGLWSSVAQTRVAPAGRTSVRIEISLYKRSDLNPVEAYVDQASLTGQYDFVKGDIDRDGETDLLLHNNTTGANQAWPMNNEERAAAPLTITPTPPSLDWQVAGIDDFNADGQNDLLMWNAATGAAEFWLMNGAARVGAAVPLAGALAPPWKPAATADFNHDGRPDIVWRNYVTQKISVWTMNLTTQIGTITPSPDQAVASNWEIVAAQDLNADGNVDLLWYNLTSGKIVYWWMDANAVRIIGDFTNPANAGANNWSVVAGGDYGIGSSINTTALAGTNDIVWRNATSGRLVVWFMDTAGNRSWGTFITPDPAAPATDWTVAGPR